MVKTTYRSALAAGAKLIVLFFIMMPLPGAAQQQKGRTDTLGQTTQVTTDILLSRIDTIHTTLNRISAISGRGFDTRDISKELPDIETNLRIIDENLSLYTSVLDIKNVQMFQILLGDMKDQLSDWRTSLFKYNKELVNMNAQITSFTKDSLLRQFAADSTYKSLYLNELSQLKQKWVLANTLTNSNLAKINQLQANVSNDYFQTIDLQSKVRAQMRNLGVKSLSKEYDYIWNIKTPLTTDRQIYQLARKSYQGQRKILLYYFEQNYDVGAWILVIGIVLFWWIWKNFRKLRSAGVVNPVADLHLTYIRPLPVLAVLAILFNLVPLFDLHPPSAYVQIMQFFLLVTLTILFARHRQGKLFYYWLFIVLLYLLFSVTAWVLIPGIKFRLWLLLLNGISVVFGLLFIYRFSKSLTLSGVVTPVLKIYVILNVLAAFCNIYGRLSLAKVFSTTAIFGLTQIIGLSVFIQIIKESIKLQAEVIQRSGGNSGFTFEKIDKELGRLLNIVAVFTWTLIFSINLNIYNAIFYMGRRILTKPRVIGNTSFEIGNILLFILIIYISHLLQKLMGYLFGISEDHLIPVDGRKKGSRLVMTRLIIIVLGFLLAIAASGLPVDKITIVLGALGVGIGLGLQNIVNNLVSGIILIFERPFQIGDYVELDNKKGIVRDIGIRSSKLVTQEGAEIIMPNADLLSGRLVNWTSRNNNARIDLPFAIETGPSLEDVKQVIVEELGKSNDVLQTVQPEILLNSVSEKALNITIQVWITNVNKNTTIKSELLTSIYKRLNEKQIKVL